MVGVSQTAALVFLVLLATKLLGKHLKGLSSRPAVAPLLSVV